MEYNPFEFIKTNIIGTQNIIDVAIDLEIEKIVAKYSLYPFMQGEKVKVVFRKRERVDGK